MSKVSAQEVSERDVVDPQAREKTLALRRPGLWLPALVAFYPLAAVACLTSPWVFRTPDGLPASGDVIRIAGWVALAAAAAAAALGWVFRSPRRRIVFEADGFSMPPFQRASGSTWIPYEDVHAVHPWKALGLARRPQVVLALRNRIPRFWSARAFADPDALDRLVTSVRAGVARLPTGDGRLHEIERRAAAAAVARRGLPVVSLVIALILGVTHWIASGSRGLRQEAYVAALATGPEAFENGELFRWVTGSLLHLDAEHLLVNLFGLLLMGLLCERLVGARRFLVVLLGSALGCAVVSTALLDQLSVGASGAISGAFACLLFVMFAYRDEVPGPFHSPLWWYALWIGVAIALEGFWPGNINHLGHAAGFAAGALLSAATIRGRPLSELHRRRSRLVNLLGAGLPAIFIGCVAWGLLSLDWTRAS